MFNGYSFLIGNTFWVRAKAKALRSLIQGWEGSTGFLCARPDVTLTILNWKCSRSIKKCIPSKLSFLADLMPQLWVQLLWGQHRWNFSHLHLSQNTVRLSPVCTCTVHTVQYSHSCWITKHEGVWFSPAIAFSSCIVYQCDPLGC